MPEKSTLQRDPEWYRNAVIYQTHVRAYFDSNEDGVGDFPGLTRKLDYIQDLGATAIWLLPFYPSPLRDGGYDISNYTDVNPSYGTIDDFIAFVEAAHARGLRVITELVLNHTSDQHPWFKRARRAPPGSREREFYVWSDDPDKYAGTRIIFKDFEASNWTWDPKANAYYWHRFYSHQPDLNWDNPEVEQEMQNVIRFWLERGVDGLRLDAVPYLYQREGTNNENLPETHQALKRLRAFIDENFEDRMLLAEANQWPEDAVAYFGDGDECHMAFQFPIMPRLFMALMTEDRFPLIDIIQQTPELPDGCQWALFLRNHDELTLEMVSDEERDYMYRVYAGDQQARINLGIRRRLAPLLQNHRPKIQLLNALLFAFKGTPIVYYGDEIGMGDNIYLGDRDGVRTPMQWTADRNAGFSTANPQRLYLPVNIDPEYRFEAVNVEAQQTNPYSLWWWMKRLIGARRRLPVLGRGSIEFLFPENPKILAFLRCDEEQEMLIVANLSRSVEFCQLDLSRYEGRTPIEVFGRARFPRIGQLPYLLTLDAHVIYWLDVSERKDTEEEAGIIKPQALRYEGAWTDLLSSKRLMLEEVLPKVLRPRRWFGGKAKEIADVQLEDVVVMGEGEDAPRFLLLEVAYDRGPSETYAVCVAYLEGGEAKRYISEHSWAALVRIDRSDEDRQGLIIDALDLPEVRDAILDLVGSDERWTGEAGRIKGVQTSEFESIRSTVGASTPSFLLRAEQSNTSIDFSGNVIMKMFRRLSPGVNPDLEIGRHLTENTEFSNFPRVAGALEYVPRSGESYTLALVQEFVRNEGDAWTYTLQELSRFFDTLLAGQPQLEAPGEVTEHIGGYLYLVALLAERVAEMHAALAKKTDDEAMEPERYGSHAQRGLYQSMRTLAGRNFDLLRKGQAGLDEADRDRAEHVLRSQEAVMDRLKSLLDVKLTSLRIRCHGDLHLGQVLFTGRDFYIIDFEGEPARPIGERRIKRSPYRDVAGMVRSFDYAAHAALRAKLDTGVAEPDTEGFELIQEATRSWTQVVVRAFLDRYEEVAGAAGILPVERREREILLDTHLLEKVVYELGYELNNRPDWVHLPLNALLEMLDAPKD